MRSRIVGALTGAAILIGGYGVPPGGNGGGGTTGVTEANLWVQTGGGTCSRSASLVDFAHAGSPTDTICGTWDQANDQCQNNDVVGIKAGSYGSQTLNGNNGRTAHCLMGAADGEAVTVGSIDNGIINNHTGATQLTISGLGASGGHINATGSFDSDATGNVEFDYFDWNFGGGSVTQPFHTENVNASFTIKHSEIHNVTNANSMWYASGSGPWLVEDTNVYDSFDTTGGANHTECMYTTPVSNMTMRRVHYWGCATMDIFFTGSNTATNWNIENSVFEHPLGPNTNCLAMRSGGSPTPQPDGFTLRNVTMGRECGWQPGDNPQPTANGLFLYGNIFIDAPPPCSGTNVTADYNLSVGSCGTHNTTATKTTILNGFVDPVQDGSGGPGPSAGPGDYSLLTGSVAKDACQPNAYPGDSHGYPATDILGHTRPFNSIADCGAYEFGAT